MVRSGSFDAFRSSAGWFRGWVLCLAILVGATTEAASPPAPQDNGRFVHFTVETGLSQNTVRAIHQDRSGFLWFATEEGLNRYDGYTFVVFKHIPDQPDSLANDMVTALCEDRAGRLWVGTLTGLSLFSPRTRKFEHKLQTQREVMAVVEAEGALWVATAGDGVYRFDKGASKPVHYLSKDGDPHSLSSDTVYALLADKSGRIWIGTNGGGLNLYDSANNRFIRYRYDANDPKSLSNDQIWSLAEDSEGQVWVGTNGGGISVLDSARGTFRRYHATVQKADGLPDFVTSLHRDKKGTMWVGTDWRGLSKYVADTDSFTSYVHDPDNPESLTRNAVRAIHDDSQGNLWVSTFAEGLSLLRRNDHPFVYYSRRPPGEMGLSDSGITAFLEDRDGTLWVGTGEGGFHRFDPATGRFTLYKLGRFTALTIWQDRKGRIWVGTYSGGLQRFDAARGIFVRHTKGLELTDTHIWDIDEDADGALWLATDAGAVRLDPDSGNASRYRYEPGNPESLADDRVRAFHLDELGNVWIATQGGLDVLRRDRSGYVGHYRHDERKPGTISHDWVLSFHKDRAGRLWLGTFGGGLNRFDPDTGHFTAYKADAGLPSNGVYSILEDDKGRLWLGTHKGLCRFDPRSSTTEIYDLTNGLQSLQFNRDAAVHTRTGQMLFGSWKGFYYFDPNRIVPRTQVAPLVLTSFQLFSGLRKNQLIAPDADEIRLDHDEDIFLLEFAVLDYAFPRRNQYEYKMDGLDEDWVQRGTRRDIPFNNLSPGGYTLRVRGSNSDGVWDKQGTTLRIVIAPPFWATVWFRALCVAAAVGLTFSLHRFRVRRLEERERELEERVEEAMSRVKILKGLLPICASCKKIRDDQGYWSQIEEYIRDRSDADFTHGICPECIPKYYTRRAE